MLRKQSSLKGIDEDIEHLLEVLYRKLNKEVLLTDLDKVLVSLRNREYEGLELTSKIKKIINDRKVYDGYKRKNF